MQIYTYKYEFHTIKLHLAATSFIKPPLYSDHFKYLGPKLHYCKTSLVSKADTLLRLHILVPCWSLLIKFYHTTGGVPNNAYMVHTVANSSYPENCENVNIHKPILDAWQRNYLLSKTNCLHLHAQRSYKWS